MVGDSLTDAETVFQADVDFVEQNAAVDADESRR